MAQTVNLYQNKHIFFLVFLVLLVKNNLLHFQFGRSRICSTVYSQIDGVINLESLSKMIEKKCTKSVF